MSKVNRRQSFIFFVLSTFLLVFTFWITLAPTQLGGWVTYVIVDGNSMEPGFYLGDLVLVRAQPTYAVGDAVVYRNGEMSSFVFHRIVGLELDRFILQGDNNAWLDSYRPVQEEVVGKLWLRIPKIGKAIEWLRVPIHMSLTVGIMAGTLMFDIFKKPSRSKKGNNPPSANWDGVAQGTFYGFGFVALVFLGLALYSFTRSLYRPAEKILYQQDGYYIYSATGTPGIYDTEMIRSGEPVFPKLTCFLNISFNYNLVADRLQGVSGTYQMYARVLDEQSGWQRTVPLNAQTSYNGNSYFTTATLDLCQVESLVNFVEQQAGLKQIIYNLEIVTDVVFTASVDGNQVSDSFSPRLVFKYDKVHFYLANDGMETDVLHSSKQGLASNSSSQPNTILVFGMLLSVWHFRIASLLGFVVALLGLTAAGLHLYRTAGQNQEALIRLKYGAILMDVHRQSSVPASSVIDVATIDDLARLAERHSTMIMHMTRDLLHYYFVQNNGTMYCYVLGNHVNRIAESVRKEPAVVASPICREARNHKRDQQENEILEIFPVQNKKAESVSMRTGKSKDANVKPITKDSREYVLKTDLIENANPTPREPVEYFIDTGVIESAMPQQDTKILRKIKLKQWDPHFAS